MTPNADTSFIPDLPVGGPLAVYRRQATFDWKQMKLVFEDPETLKLKMHVWSILEAEPLFHRSSRTEDLDEQRRIAAKQLVKYHGFKFYDKEVLPQKTYRRKTRTIMTLNEATEMVSTCASVKLAIGVGLFTNALLNLGTERHLKFYTEAWSGKILGSVAITEVGHGSNTKQIRTTATYDPTTEEFVINTPDFEAAKCFVGNIGKTCTHSLLFAQLITPDGTSHGIHGFIVPVRNSDTLLPYPGIVVGDCGEKIGLNGIDNGFILFNNYRIPRDNFLNRTSDVTPEGEFLTSFTNIHQQLVAALENLSAGRVGIMQESANTLCLAVCIAVRYAAVRKQFSATQNGPEAPIIEYPLLQWRIFPLMAAACALKIFVASFTDIYLDCAEKSNSSVKLEDLSSMVSEIHSMVSACKALITWTGRDAIQECREACGGNGYLKAAGFGDLRNNHDAKVTYEGDNNVLVQQASNWLLRQWQTELKTPFGSARFLGRLDSILASRFKAKTVAEVTTRAFIVESYEWLLCWLVKSTNDRFHNLLKSGVDRFSARNQIQVYRARTLALAYGENNTLEYFWNKCQQADASLRPVLETLHHLYGLWSLEKHMTTLYEAGYSSEPSLAQLVRDAILELCLRLKPEAVAIIDALAPPDFVTNSILGRADGRVYDHIQTEFFHNKEAMERPKWWEEIVTKEKSKL